MRLKMKLEECTCGNKVAHTRECISNYRKNYQVAYKVAYRKKVRDLQSDRKKNHLCIECGKKVNPIQSYPLRCEFHFNKLREYNKGYRLMKQGVQTVAKGGA